MLAELIERASGRDFRDYVRAEVIEPIGLTRLQLGVPRDDQDDINTLVHDYTIKHGAWPSPLNYHGFPKSVCTSVNEVVCHGIPSDRTLRNGDIVNLDVTVIKDGYHGDTSRMFMVGAPSIMAERLTKVCFDAMWRGIREMRPGGRLGDIGHAIQSYVEEQRFSVVREYCGHGIGSQMHMPPNVPNVVRRGERQRHECRGFLPEAGVLSLEDAGWRFRAVADDRPYRVR